ncbi:MFS transporter [Streptomyces acidiscabies]|uniref:MFS transporter n=2 Tax=Streptomyces acidiscabies TaxID=42234 RepID=A0AAP6B5S6_9ACTN|nr:MFS transporter [Streptomyces acidiscabies]MDX2958692.1 MFS transporter [Streptomyces acidiscabies]MDX3018130.1 MFS transporter [Streptomyces acidiscabies]MDX3791527.1 MFS transporter [Streptomyces acidiscabies]
MRARGAHRDPNVLRWLAGFTLSGVGDNVYYIALSWAAVQSGTPVQAGLVTVAGALPRAVLMLGGGVLADRYGARRVVLGSTGVRCALVLSAAVLLFFASPGLWVLGAVAVLFGVVDAAFLPAAGALPALIAPPGEFGRVQGLRGLSTRLANVLGGPLGGVGVALGGTAGAFGAAALLIGVSWPVLGAVRVRAGVEADPRGRVGSRDTVSVRGGVAAGSDASARGRTASGGVVPARGGGGGAGWPERGRGWRVWRREEAWAGSWGARWRGQAWAGGSGAWGDWRRGVVGELVDGVRYVRRDRVLSALVLAITLSDLGFVGPMNLGLTLLAGERGWGASGLGLVLAGFGVGAGAASLLLAWRGRVPRAGLVLAGATVGGALAIAALARVPSVAGAVAVALCVGLLAGLGGALAGTLVQSRAGAAYIGRVTAVSTLIGYGVAPLTFPVVGWAVSLWGTGPVFTACATLNGLSAVVVLGVRGLRRAELPG